MISHLIKARKHLIHSLKIRICNIQAVYLCFTS
jgi:hypothetical protein